MNAFNESDHSSFLFYKIIFGRKRATWLFHLGLITKGWGVVSLR